MRRMQYPGGAVVSEAGDIEKKKKTNQKLAIGVGALGVGAFGAFYVIFFLVMIFKPGLFFSMMPTPSSTTAALSDGNRTYLLTKTTDLSKLSVMEKRKPPEKQYLAVLEGTKLLMLQEIPPHDSASGANNRIVLFSEGMYRSFDGARWTVVKTDSIGQEPVGLVAPDGLYVVSSFSDTARLNRITDTTVTSIPLPKQFLSDWKKRSCHCAQLAWYQGRLCLFWPAESTIYWTIWNGSAWMPVATSPYSGGYQVLANEDRLFFFHREGSGANRVLSLYVFENNDWTGPTRLSIVKEFRDWHVFMHKGKPMLLVLQGLSQTLYTVEKVALTNPVYLDSEFSPARMVGSLAALVIIMNSALVLSIFGFSTLIRHFKDRRWTENGTEYEFASLFRRFIAYVLDNVFMIIPPALMIALFVIVEGVPRGPLPVVLMVIATLAFYFLGGFLYQSLLEGLFGATLGKRICGIRVLKHDFTPCTVTAGFLRNLMRIVDAFFYYLVGTVSLAATLKWQRFGDVVAETVVVRTKTSRGVDAKSEKL
jgi:uncharacterized RDD family membrane protein YckC